MEEEKEKTQDKVASETPSNDYPSLWRDTMSDGLIAVRNFSHQVQEMKQADLKEEKYDFDKVVTLELTRFTD